MKNRLRMLLGLLAGVIFLVLQIFFPDLPFTEEQTIAFVILIGAYIVGEGLEGERIKDNFKAMLQSHKFQALVAGLLLWVLEAAWPEFPISESQLVDLMSILATLIVGAGIQGAVTKK